MADSKEWARLGSRSHNRSQDYIGHALCADDPDIRSRYLADAITAAEEAVRLLVTARHAAEMEDQHTEEDTTP